MATALTSLIDLSGRTAVVTGAAAGMGLATARRLAEAGAFVVVADIDAQGAAAAAESISAAGLAAQARTLDVRDVAAISELAASTATEGRLDVWVNNAGIYPPAPLFGAEQEDWDRMMDVNSRSVYFGSREAARWMIKSGRGGVVVNIASIAAYRAGSPNLAHYAASKAAVVVLTKTLASTFGRHGIRVVGVAPGVIDTDGVRAGLADMDAQGINLGDRGPTIPLGRIGTGDDIARVVVFLASDLAAFVTGQTITVDGGDLIMGRAAIPDLADQGFVG